MKHKFYDADGNVVEADHCPDGCSVNRPLILMDAAVTDDDGDDVTIPSFVLRRGRLRETALRVCERLKTPFGNRRAASSYIFGAVPKQARARP